MAPVLFVLLALAFVSSAAAATQRPFKETFGPAAKPSFGVASGVVVDQATGDVLIADASGNTIKRFHADGTPDPFTALGSNTIDGAEANGKPCAEEPASCDKTEQNGIKVPSLGDAEEARFQIAIDESGGPTDGDIYLTQSNPSLVDIFAEDGHYLGQLTEAGVREFAEAPDGVAVNPSGTVYVTNGRAGVSKFVPTANPVVNTDFVENILLPEHEGARGTPYNIALGAGPTAGSLFAAYLGSECVETPIGLHCEGIEGILQIDEETGQELSEFDISTSRFVNGWIAVSPGTGNVLDGSGLEFEVPAGSEPVRVSRFIPKEALEGGVAINGANEAIALEGTGPSSVSVYGLPATVPAVTTEPPSEVGGTEATLNGTVNPSGLPVTKCVFRFSGREIPCEKGAWETATDSEPHPVHAALTGLEPNGVEYDFSLVAFNANGQEETESRSFTTAHTVVTEPATAIGQTSATLNGIVRPEGSAYTECFFEYGLSSSRSFEKKVPCKPGATAIPAEFSPVEVKAVLGGLESGATYRYRLVATNAALGTLAGEEQTFSTFGLPRIEEVHASGADQGSVILEARINPSGFGTSYRFEWGQTPAYGNLAPVEFEPFIGSGTEPILVKSKISGLAAGSTYHYRVTATSNRGVVQSPDQIAETLNTCGLPEGRCFELVSRKEAGPIAIPGEGNSHIEMHYQAATEGPGALAYEVEGGYLEATKGAEVLYRGLRGPDGWESTQLSAPLSALNERSDTASINSAVGWLSNDISCGFIDSTQPLTPDPSMKLVREEGGGNLYRIDPDGSYTPVSALAPSNPNASSFPDYSVAGASQDCGVTLFSTAYRYPGVPVHEEGSPLYEWREGTLRDAGIVPGPAGEVAVIATPGLIPSNSGEEDTQNTVSEDGSRIFFSAARQTSPDPSEIGKPAVFVREDGRETRDVSLSETAVPDEGARYQWATADGSKVFFTANAGLTEESNHQGTDLYEYDLEKKPSEHPLTDRSVTPAAGGAQVVGFLGSSADGSRVYFASRNQLIPGKGNSLAQNVNAKTYSIYSGREGEISFVGTFAEAGSSRVLIAQQEHWTSQVSPDGRYLLFESSARVTGYENAGLNEADLYDADSQQTTCVTCRQDGQPSPDERYGSPTYELLTRGEAVFNHLHGPRFLAERNGEAHVFFSSPDPLAPGAVAGQNNIYEWSHDQIFRLAGALEGSQETPFPGLVALFAGASDDASDIYLITPETLNWEDGDARFSAYDARIGGGFPQPPPPPAPCQATAEGQGSCLGAGQGVAGTPGPTSTGDRGAQNFEPQKKKSAPKKKQKKHKKKSKHKKKQSKKKKQKKSKRQANANRRKGK